VSRTEGSGRRWRHCAVGALAGGLAWLAAPAVAQEQAAPAAPAPGEPAAQAPGEPAAPAPGVIKLDETVISGNQELPKVLYIVPWQPQGLPDIELSTGFSEMELFRRLYPPAYRRELAYAEAATRADASSEANSTSNDSRE
jgi:hypothetical protein